MSKSGKFESNFFVENSKKNNINKRNNNDLFSNEFKRIRRRYLRLYTSKMFLLACANLICDCNLTSFNFTIYIP